MLVERWSLATEVNSLGFMRESLSVVDLSRWLLAHRIARHHAWSAALSDRRLGACCLVLSWRLAARLVLIVHAFERPGTALASAIGRCTWA